MYEISNESWESILHLAIKARDARVIFYSPKEGRPYIIKQVTKKSITIGRTNANDELLRRGSYISFIKRISEQQYLHRHHCSNLRVATLATIVFLHPMLKWESNNDVITFTRVSEYINPESIPDDNTANTQAFARKVRRGQLQFRKVLLDNYYNQCCVTNCSVLEVLDACHIEPHSINGINKLENGLLLRTDIHSLFDANLILINPNDYTVHIHPTLKKSSYYKLHLKKIKGKKMPGHTFLARKWESRDW